ncbi:unnamed protein product [Prorocentrum cordatum]|uniref:Uncharacterized protein n=1 Tax=Prorocentrum cordatum TaxID=2364126 RepID=A0ABN9YC15_9DINO|nr:unnamed protein product [Polarella glacialis]
MPSCARLLGPRGGTPGSAGFGQINSLWPVGVSGAGDAMLTIVDHYKSAVADLGEAIGGSLKASPEVLEKSASKWLRTGEQLCEALHKFSVSIAQDPLPDEVVKHLLQRAETAIQQTPAADRKGADQSPRQAPAGQPPGAAGPPAEDGRPRELLPRQTNKFTKAVGTVAAATMACRVAKRSSAEDAKEEIKNLIEQVLQEMPPTSEVVQLAHTCAELGDNIESVSQRRQKLKDHIGELQGRLRSLAEEAEAAAAPSPMRSREPSAERAAAAAAAWMDAANAGPGKGGSHSPSKRRTVRLEDAAKLVAQQAAEEGAVGPRAGPSPRLSPRGVSSAAASPRLAPPGGGPAAGRGGAGRGASKEQPRQEETTDNAGEEAAMNRTRLQAAQAKLDSSKQSRTELQAKCSALAAELQRLRALQEAQKRADAELVALETASTPAAAVKATRPPKEQAELAQMPALPSPEVEEQRRPAGIDSDTERERGPEGAGVPGAPDVSGPRDHAVAPPPKAAGQPEPAAGASGAGHGAEEQGRQEAAETEERSAALVRPCGAASASRSALAPPMEAQSPAGLRPPPPAAAAEDAGAPQNAAPAVGTAEAASAVLVDEGTREPLEPWLQAFPEDSPEDAFARFDFCSRFGLEPQSLYDGATQQTVLTQLRHQIAQKRLLLEQLAPSKGPKPSQSSATTSYFCSSLAWVTRSAKDLKSFGKL